MFSFKKKEKIEVPLQIPKHIGIIMDGNGRWAKKRMQPRVFGHKSGMETLQNVTIAAKELGVQVLTVFYRKLVSSSKRSQFYHEFAC